LIFLGDGQFHVPGMRPMRSTLWQLSPPFIERASQRFRASKSSHGSSPSSNNSPSHRRQKPHRPLPENRMIVGRGWNCLSMVSASSFATPQVQFWNASG
jgi:hypothetical protein